MTTRDILAVVLLLIVVSVLLYSLHFAIFHDAHHIFLYLIGDLAFLPLQVLLLTFLVDRLLSERERRGRRHKMNMVIGAFFSAVGIPLLKIMDELLRERELLHEHLAIAPDWTERQISQARAALERASFSLAVQPVVLGRVRDLLRREREFMLRLLENPTLLEHETFTDLLWAVLHLGEELGARGPLENLPASDLQHLAADADRAYTRLLRQWLGYMAHLQADYPYLFSFAARTNPLRPDARPEVV